MISHRILGCLFLILLTQYGNALRSRYAEYILNTLHRIENRLENLKFLQETKQPEPPTLNCLVPAERIFNLISEISKISKNDTDETQITRRNVAPVDSESIRILQKALGFDDETDVESLFRRPVTQQTKDKKRNENKNANINTNTNFNANYFNARRTLDDISHLNKRHNQNVNTNYNANTNLNKRRNIIDLLDFSDEEKA